MQNRTLKADVLLLLAAIIWGGAFVAQRVGMAHVGPFTFNGVRFVLGALSLLPLFLFQRKRGAFAADPPLQPTLLAGGLIGLALFLGVSLQQIGLLYTTAGKAGFITGLYVVLVPIVGIALKQRTALSNWVGAILAVIGLYWLSVTEEFTIAKGDLFEMAGAVVWSLHIHLIARFSRKIAPLKISLMQFIVCSVLSLLTALLFEDITWNGVVGATIPILYGGVLSVGVAYTLQIVGQRDAHPAHAAILLSLEAVFAVFTGWLIIGETLSPRGLVGCGLMLAGMVISQFTITTDRLTRWFSSTPKSSA